MNLPDNLGRKSPKWSWFPGLVPVSAVWSDDMSVETQQTNTRAAVQDALPLWYAHTINTIIGIMGGPQQVRGPHITSNLRKEVSATINSFTHLPQQVREWLLWVLDQKPSLNHPKWATDVAFDGPIERFITGREKQAILSFIAEQEWCRDIGVITLVNPRFRNQTRFLWYKIWSSWKNRLQLITPEAGKLSITLGKIKKILTV